MVPRLAQWANGLPTPGRGIRERMLSGTRVFEISSNSRFYSLWGCAKMWTGVFCCCRDDDGMCPMEMEVEVVRCRRALFHPLIFSGTSRCRLPEEAHCVPYCAYCIPTRETPLKACRDRSANLGCIDPTHEVLHLVSSPVVH